MADAKQGAVKKTIAAVAAAALVGAAYYLFFVLKIVNFGKQTAETAVKAYELYSGGEAQTDAAIFLADPETDGFKVYTVKIYETAAVANRVKQALLVLVAQPEEGYNPVVPDGTVLREAYVDPNGICYVDFSRNLTAAHRGGTTNEYLTVYGIVNTVLYNFDQVRGVKILVEGAEAPTIAGHIATGGIFTRDDAVKAGTIK